MSFHIKRIINYNIKLTNRLLRRLLRKRIKLINFYNNLLKKNPEGYLFSILIKNYNKFEINLYYTTYREFGNNFLRYSIDYCDLKPNDRVLDIGCGVGRMAYILTKYLSKGTYVGIDIKPEVIKWCRKTFTSRYPNFRFQVANLYNKYYNPKGKYLASNYKFPFKDESFDFIFMYSVFTHMLPKDMENYISEISRVLKRNGRCLITYYILNNNALKFINTKKSELKYDVFEFKYEHDEYRTINTEINEALIAYDEKKIRSLYKKYGIEIKEPVYYGHWSGNKDALNEQDVVIAVKK